MSIARKPVYWAFYISLAFVFISAFSAIYGLSLVRNIQMKVAENQIHNYLENMKLESKLELNSMVQTLKIAQNQVSNDMLLKDNPQELNKRIYTLIDGIPQVYALSIRGANGLTFNLRDKKDGWESYYTLKDELSKKYVTIADESSKIIFQGDSVVDYSVSNLIAYTKQLSVPYDSVARYPLESVPGTSRMPGICYSVRVKDPASSEDYVLTVYMSIERVYQFSSELKLHDGTEIYLFTDSGNMFRPKSEVIDSLRDTKTPRLMVSIDSSKGKPFFRAYSKWQSFNTKDTLTVFGFKDKGNQYCAVVKLSEIIDSGIWLSIIMPVKSFAEVITGELKLYFLIALMLLILSAIVAAIFYRMLKRQVVRLEELSDLELVQLIKSGESDTTEFKSTIRMNLHSNSHGKEIELAWLKSVVAFCNTQGGRILIGVSDSGEILGLEKDRFPNDDKLALHIQNLIKQHIGLQYTSYIEFKIRNIESKSFVVVRCQSSPKPVFLKFNDKEKFFVRSGPASIELPVSKALEYINDRNKKK